MTRPAYRGTGRLNVYRVTAKLRKDAVKQRCRHTGKVIFPTEDDARRALASLLLFSTLERVPQRCYPCPNGRHWHLTSASTYRGPA